MNKILLSLFLLTSVNLLGQNTITIEDFDKQVITLKANISAVQSENSRLKTSNNQLKTDIGTLNSKLNSLNAQFQILTQNVSLNTSTIETTNQNLNGKISSTEASTNQKFTEVDNSLSKNLLWSIIGILGAIIISGFVYWLVNKRQSNDKTDLIDKLSKTRLSIKESLVSEFEKQTALIEVQIKLLEEQKNNAPLTQNATEMDHSLALKVADEITLIERNISLMDQSVKGLKHLARSVSKLKDNLLANGYELPVLLGKNYNQGMKVIISSSISDENLEDGVEVITKVLKPQVNYKEVMIQTAQIEISKR
jgi:predicted nuclease with TOPRIM domain